MMERVVSVPIKKRKVILFVAETVTLAHLTRPLAIAQRMNREEYDIHIASSSIPAGLCPMLERFVVHEIPSRVTSAIFVKSLAEGKLPYTDDIIEEYIAQDRELIRGVRPDVVVGDFRLSLSISARLEQVPYVNLASVVWSMASKQKAVLPDLPLERVVGAKVGGWLFGMFRRFIYRDLAKPFNRVARRYGMRGFNDLRELYTDGDRVLFSDLPSLVELGQLPDHQQVIGPVLFSMPYTGDVDLDQKAEDRRSIYVALGSSGPNHLLPEICEALSTLDAHAYVSTSGHDIKLPSYPNLTVAKYMPAGHLIPRCSLVIGSGGSTNCYPALAEGVPFLSIPTNLDQHQYAEALEAAGVGMTIRTAGFSKAAFTEAAKELMSDPKVKFECERRRQEIKNFDFHARFATILKELVSARPSPPQPEPSVQ